MTSVLTSPDAAAPRRRSGRGGQRANTLVIVLLTIAVLSTVAGNLMWSASARYHTTYQSASWQEALVAAEAGVDLAMDELRKRVLKGGALAFQAPLWLDTAPGNLPPVPPPATTAERALLGIALDPLTYHPGQTYPDKGHLFALRPISTHDGEGNAAMSARVYVDVPGSSAAPAPAADSFAQRPPTTLDDFMTEQSDALGSDPQSHWWYRIRSLGVAGVAGPPRANLDTRDNALRRFSFFSDWRNGNAVPTPQVGRVVEIIAKPRTNFRNAIMADKVVNLSNQDVLVDSYNSGAGIYNSLLNHGNMGNLATNGQLINAGGAQVMGDAMTNDGEVRDGQRVTGQQRADFYQELPPVTRDSMSAAWSGPDVLNRFTLTDSATFTASPDRTRPTRVKLNGVNLPTGGKRISVVPPLRGLNGAPTGPSYIKIYVDGDIATQGDSAIQIADGVNAIIYFTGNVNLQGYGIFNDSFLAGRLLMNGIQPTANADGSVPARQITIATTQDFEGIIYAPSHDLNLALRAVNSGGSATQPNPQIASLQDQIRRAQEDAQHYTEEGQKKMQEYQDNGDPKKLAEANNFFAQAAQANTRVTQLTQQLNQVVGNQAQIDDHARGYNGIYGAFVARAIQVSSKTHVHYDEALREAGPVNHYEIVNWFEDVASRVPTAP